MAPFPRQNLWHRLRMRTALGIGMRVLLILVVLVAMGIGALLVGASGDGLSLSSVKENLRSSIARRLGPDFIVDLRSARLAWRSDTGFVVSLSELAVEAPDSGLRVVAPQVDLGFGLLGFATGRFAPQTAAIRHLAVRVPIIAAESQPDDARGTFAIASRLLRMVRDVAVERGVRHIMVTEASVDVTFGPGSQDLRFWHDASLTLDVSPDTRSLRLEILATGQVGRGRLVARYGPAENGDDRFTLKASDFSLFDLVPAPGVLSKFAAARIPLYPDFSITFAPDDSIDDAHLEMIVGAGKVDVGEGDVALLDEARVIATWDRADRSFKLQPSVAEFGETRFHFSGYLRPTVKDTLDHWRYGLEITDAVIKPRDDPGPAVRVDRIHTEGRISARQRFLGIEAFTVDQGGRRIVTGAGSVGIGPDGPSLAMAIDFAPVSGLVVKRLWPNPVAAPARRWVQKNLIEAEQMWGRAVFALGPENLDGDPATFGWPDDAVEVTVKVKNARIHTFGDLPDATIPSASGSLKAGRFVLDADSASAVAASGGKVDISKIRFVIDDVRPRENDAEISMDFAGSTEAIASLANAKPIEALKRIKVAPSDLSGTATAELDARFPLVEELEMEDASWRVVAKLADFASKKPINGQRVTDGDLTLKVDTKRAQITGRAKFDDLAVDVDVIEPLDGSSSDARRDMTLILTDAERKKRGIDLGAVLEGPIGVSIDIAAGDDRRRLTVDLTSAQITLPSIGVVKKAGVRGTALMTLLKKGNVTEIRDLKVSARNVDVAGSARIGAKGEILSAVFGRFNIGETKGGKVKIAAGDGGLDVTLSADQYDGRPSLRTTFGKEDRPDADVSENLRLKADFGRMIGFNGVVLTDVSLVANTDRGLTTRLDLTGVLGGSDRLNTRVRSDGSKRYLNVDTTDVGRALRFVDLYARMRGGSGKLEATLIGSDRAAGNLRIRNFAIADDPGLKEIIKRTQSGARTANGRVPAAPVAPASGNAAFERLDVTYSKNGPHVKIGDAVLRGAIIGGTMRGAIDLDKRRIDVVGTMVPAYGINNLFGRIPLLGDIVGGGSDGGLIGITFKMEGPLDNAKLVFNPVSAVAPGIFRKIFEYR